MSIIAPDLVVTGDLVASGVVRVEGRVHGSVIAEQQILLSQGGAVAGDMRTREAVLAGEVNGSVTATDRIEVQSSAVVNGDIVTPRLLIQEGGRINGAIRMESVTTEATE